MQYTVVEEITKMMLEGSVNDMIKKGWKPLGGPIVTVSNETRQTVCYQAMIKE